MFSKKIYAKILDKYASQALDVVDIYATEPKCFALLRHDVEFSLERARRISDWNNEFSFQSSVLVQVYCDAYNIFSVQSKSILHSIDISKYSTVGLHLYISHLECNDWDGFYRELTIQAQLLSDCIGRAVDRFSIHRPPAWTLQNRSDVICGMLNFYGDSFFEYKPAPKHIKYLADSQHCFKYGHPLDSFSHQKYHLLLHPDEWTEAGEEAQENFNLMQREHSARFEQCLKAETNHYSKVGK